MPCAVVDASDVVVAVIMADPSDAPPDDCTLIAVPDDGSVYTGCIYNSADGTFRDPNAKTSDTGSQF